MQKLNNSAKFSPPSSVKIGIDIDGVCADFSTPFTKYLNEKTGQSIATSEIKDYSWWKCFAGLSEGDFWKHFDEYGMAGHYRNFPIFRDAKRYLPILLNSFDYHFITSRPDYTYDDTIVWLQRNFGPIRDDKITFCRGDKKSKFVKELNVDIFIDDAPHHAEDIAWEAEIPVYVMDAPYNKTLSTPPDSYIRRIYSWRDFYKESFSW